MTDDASRHVSISVEHEVPLSRESIYIQIGKPDVLTIHGTSEGLRRLSWELLRASAAEASRDAMDDVACLHHVTRNHDTLDALMHPRSPVRILGIAAWTQLPPMREGTRSRSGVGVWGSLVVATGIGIAAALGLRDIVLWLWRVIQ